MKKILCFASLFLGSILFVGCGGPREDLPPTAMDISEPSVYTLLMKESKFQSFVSMIEKADLERWLNDERNVTVFAPTNEAIQPLLQDREAMSRMIADPTYVVQGVRSHIIPRRLTFDKLRKMEQVFDTNEQAIPIIGGENSVMLDGRIQVINDPIEAGNGIIYPITGVLMEN